MSGTTEIFIGTLPVVSVTTGLKLLGYNSLGQPTGIDPPAVGGGTVGPAGPAGSTGPAGTNGISGNTVRSGAGGPSAGLGANGDFYIDTASADYLLYGPKAGGAWPTPGVALRVSGGTGGGATGATGATGAPGADGKSIYTGSGTPSAGVGINGDLYIDTASVERLLYGPKASGIWPGTTVALRGPVGATGPAGPTSSLSDATPIALGAAASAGVAATASRADHVHVRPTATEVGAAATAHVHTIAGVTGLQAAIDGKAPTVHTHTISSVTGLQAAIDAKAPTAHSHATADVAGLDAALTAKQALSARGVANGYAPLDATGKVPAVNLPVATGGTGTSNVNNGTVAGQVPVWDTATARYVPQPPSSIVSDRTPTVEYNTATILTFANHNRRNIVLSAIAPLSLASNEVGTAPAQGMEFVVNNDHTAQNTITFGAGITVRQPAGGTGTGGAVKIASLGLLAVMIYPKGATLVAKCRGDVA